MGVDKQQTHALPEQLAEIAGSIRAIAHAYKQDISSLLALLRMLESSHREIRDGAFQEALPDNRQTLYALLKDIETEGGWPYIQRLKISALLEKMSQSELDELFPVEGSTNTHQPDSTHALDAPSEIEAEGKTLLT